MKIFAFRELQRGGTLSPTSGCDEQMKVHQLTRSSAEVSCSKGQCLKQKLQIEKIRIGV